MRKIKSKVVPFCDKEKPEETACKSGLQCVHAHVGDFLVHAHEQGQRGRLSQLEPGGVVLLQAKITTKKEERGGDGVGGGVLVVVARLAHVQCVLQQRHANGDVGVDVRVEVQGGGQLHVGLDHHVGAERDDQTVVVGRRVHVCYAQLQAGAVEDGLGGVHAGEEEIDAALDELEGEGAGGAHGDGRMRRAGALEAGMAAVLAGHGRVFQDAFDFAAMAGVACPLGRDCRRFRHGGAGCVDVPGGGCAAGRPTNGRKSRVQADQQAVSGSSLLPMAATNYRRGRLQRQWHSPTQAASRPAASTGKKDEEGQRRIRAHDAAQSQSGARCSRAGRRRRSRENRPRRVSATRDGFNKQRAEAQSMERVWGKDRSKESVDSSAATAVVMMLLSLRAAPLEKKRGKAGGLAGERQRLPNLARMAPSLPPTYSTSTSYVVVLLALEPPPALLPMGDRAGEAGPLPVAFPGRRPRCLRPQSGFLFPSNAAPPPSPFTSLPRLDLSFAQLTQGCAVPSGAVQPSSASIAPANAIASKSMAQGVVVEDSGPWLWTPDRPRARARRRGFVGSELASPLWLIITVWCLELAPIARFRNATVVFHWEPGRSRVGCTGVNPFNPTECTNHVCQAITAKVNHERFRITRHTGKLGSTQRQQAREKAKQRDAKDVPL
ncbi:hypothetical protein FH972_025958 [Carpinus fangiana]|uniref:Uncharacterized protein n=1 Tax=Carpinus fangiana TaxID=176857 RepID=A0A5N6L2X4_9ROSI|nr:hypothetical protein FH972_025958 [Carpinus fangiana]